MLPLRYDLVLMLNPMSRESLFPSMGFFFKSIFSPPFRNYSFVNILGSKALRVARQGRHESSFRCQRTFFKLMNSGLASFSMDLSPTLLAFNDFLLKKDLLSFLWGGKVGWQHIAADQHQGWDGLRLRLERQSPKKLALKKPATRTYPGFGFHYVAAITFLVDPTGLNKIIEYQLK